MKKKMIYLAGLAVFVGACMPDVLSTEGIKITDPSLVAHWTFDEGTIQQADTGDCKVIDSSYYRNDGEGKGCKIVKGIFGNALQFNGKGDYVNFPVPRPENLEFTNALTVMLWINCEVQPKKRSALVIGDGAYYSGWRITQSGKPHINRFTFELGGRGGIRRKTMGGCGGPAGWVHIAATFDNSLPENNMTFYVNGKKQHRAIDKKDEIKITSGKNPVSVGKEFGGANWFKGKMDELLMYNRCLSEKEIKAEYLRGKTQAEKSIPDENALDK